MASSGFLLHGSAFITSAIAGFSQAENCPFTSERSSMKRETTVKVAAAQKEEPTVKEKKTTEDDDF